MKNNYLFKSHLIWVLLSIASIVYAHDFEVDGIYYNRLSGLEVEVTQKNGGSNSYSGEIQIPLQVQDNGFVFNVVRIGEGAFAGCQSLTLVDIPESITSIAYDAFDACSARVEEGGIWYVGKWIVGVIDMNRTAYTLRSNTIGIADFSFSDCTELTAISLPPGLKYGGDRSFGDCVALTEIHIPEGITKISSNAFSGCTALKSISLPRSLEKIEEYAFSGCSSLESVTCLADYPPAIGENVFRGISENAVLKLQGASERFYSWSSWIPFSKKEHIYAHVTDNKCGYPNVTWNLSETPKDEPSDVTTYTLTISGEGEMMDYSPENPAPWHEYAALIDSVYISEDITALGRYAFEGCARLPVENFVRYAGRWAIGVTDNTLDSYVLRNNTIGLDATFRDCAKIVSQELPDGLKYIGYAAFEKLHSQSFLLSEVKIPESVVYIGDFAFASTNMPEIHIPGNVKRIGYRSFVSIRTSKVTIDDGVEEIGCGAFANASINEVVLPNTLKQIASFLFQQASIENIYIPSSVKKIGAHAFASCRYLSQVLLPDGITEIGQSAFNDCSMLRQIVLPENLKEIGAQAFNNCRGLTSLSIPDNVVSIGSLMFLNCNSLSELSLGKGLRFISRNIISMSPASALKRIKCYSLVPPVCANGTPFNGITARCTLEVYENALPLYQQSAIWRGFKIVSMELPAFFVQDGIKYEYNSNGTAEVVDCDREGDVEIPAQVTYEGTAYNVTSIASKAFQDNQKITSLILPEGVVEIGINAFRNCANLSVLELPEGLTTIGQQAFAGCTGLSRLNIPSTLVDVDLYAFRDCKSLSSLSLQAYPRVSLEVCQGLKEIHIGDSLKFIPVRYFAGLKNLEKVVLSDNITEIEEGAFVNCEALKEINIPEGVEIIRPYVFFNCKSLASISIPAKVEIIGGSAFSNCSSLKTITIPESVMSIGYSAFEECTSLEKAEFPSIEKMCQVSFASFTANPLYYANHLYIDGREIFDLVIPESVTSIGSYAFTGGLSFKSITIPESVTYVGRWAFDCSGLEREDNVYYADKWAVNIQYADLGDELQYALRENTVGLAYGLFNGCNSLDTMVLPEGLLYICDQAFSSCHSLKAITFGKQLRNIGQNAFSDCISMASVHIPGGVRQLGYGVFYNCTSLVSLTLSEGLESIKECLGGCISLTNINIPSTVTEIDEYLFRDCSALQRMVISSAIMPRISFCTQLNEVHIGKDMTSIPENAFQNMKSLSKVYLGENIRHIGENAFASCDSLKHISLPNGLLSIGNDAFSRSGLTSADIMQEDAQDTYEGELRTDAGLPVVMLPSGITDIGSRAFSYCKNIKSIVLPENITSIVQNTFQNCTSLKEVSVPEGVTLIGPNAFSGCTGLTSVSLPSSLTQIERGVFQRCRNLVSICCTALEPPTCNHVSSLSGIHSSCVISVPQESVVAYQNADVWKEYTIVGIETGIHDVNVQMPEKSSTYYDLNGRRVQNPLKGSVYIIDGQKMVY